LFLRNPTSELELADPGETFCIAGLLKVCLRRLTATVTFA
jgi:hypothetical protein